MTALPFVLLNVAVVFAAIFVYNGFVQIETGFVGVTYRAGRLVEGKLLDPGFHIITPVFERVESVQISTQTDAAIHTPCGTKNGVSINFDRIEIVNRLARNSVIPVVKEYGTSYDRQLVFDAVAHKVNEICSSHTLTQILIDNFTIIDDEIKASLEETIARAEKSVGQKIDLEIISVRVSKPTVPKAVSQAFEDREAARAQSETTKERARVAEIEANALARQQLIKAESELTLRRSQVEKELLVEEGEKKKQKIRDEALLGSEKAKADAELYRAEREAEANKKLHTKEFVQLETAKMMSQNEKLVYFGDRIPSYLGALLGGDSSDNNNKKK